jgi:heme-degrading monooxygenase HmoA
MTQVATTLEARVAEGEWARLRGAYEELVAQPLPPGLRETFLLQDRSDPETWRIVSVWESDEAIEAMRSAGTPGGVLVFREAGAEPRLTVATVTATRRR